jgi:uncharacterized membrane protein YedE/YeeE
MGQDAWLLLAIAIAVIGTTCSYLGYFEVSKAIYTGSSVHWLAALVGGFTFGIGMTLVGMWMRTLVRQVAVI